MDDPATGRDDRNRALAGIPADSCCVLLARSPDIVLQPDLSVRRPGLILAGHTHGGQLRLPLVGALLTERQMPPRLAMGLHMVQGVPVVVSRGVVSRARPAHRLPPEVALLTRRSPMSVSTVVPSAA